MDTAVDTPITLERTELSKEHIPSTNLPSLQLEFEELSAQPSTEDAAKLTTTNTATTASCGKVDLAVEEDVCSICLDPYTDTEPAMEFVCGHSFHFQCSESWLQRSDSCPMCWKKLQYKGQESSLENKNSINTLELEFEKLMCNNRQHHHSSTNEVRIHRAHLHNQHQVEIRHTQNENNRRRSSSLLDRIVAKFVKNDVEIEDDLSRPRSFSLKDLFRR